MSSPPTAMSSEAESRMEAIRNAITERHETIKNDREKNYEKKHENSILVRGIIEDLEKAEKDLRSDLAGVEDGKKEGVALTEALDGLAEKLSAFEKSFGQQATHLPNFDVKRFQNSVIEVNLAFMEMQDRLQPKKKFGFKGKKNKKAQPQSEEEEKPKPKATVFDDVLIGMEVKNETGKTIRVGADKLLQKDVLLKNLTDCKVFLTGNPSTMHMTQLKNCEILSGPVSTSVFIDEATDCQFALACQQLRTHRTTKSDFSLHVTSKAIVEDCREVRFAPLKLDYAGMEQHFESSGLSRATNTWNSVDDFNWLASDKPSPNWSLVPESERRAFSIPDEE